MKQMQRAGLSAVGFMLLGAGLSTALYHPITAQPPSRGGNNSSQTTPNDDSGGGCGPSGEDQNRPNRRPGPPPPPCEIAMLRQLDLTDEQKTQIKTILDKEREAIRRIHEQTRTSIGGVLTDEQKAELEALVEENCPPPPPRPGEEGTDNGNTTGNQNRPGRQNRPGGQSGQGGQNRQGGRPGGGRR